MRVYFRWRTTLVCLLLSAGMIRAAIWQWERHVQKQQIVAQLDQRLKETPVPLETLSDLDPDELEHRRVWITGSFDFKNEIVLRNRRLDDVPGVFVLTPLSLAGTHQRILVSRGFLPLDQSRPEQRVSHRVPAEGRFLVLLKRSVPHRFLAPRDPPSGGSNPWVDAWLRVDLDEIGKQMPYSLLSVWGEIMPITESEGALDAIVTAKKSGREDMLFLASRGMRAESASFPILPVPVFDAVVPPGRHLGYVYEWSIMAVMTLLIGLVLQLRPPPKLHTHLSPEAQA